MEIKFKIKVWNNSHGFMMIKKENIPGIYFILIPKNYRDGDVDFRYSLDLKDIEDGVVTIAKITINEILILL